ncbi:hypothetical protein K402DRAFT_373749 [Aulographum hederae CBS 113979]|uniref:DUF7624 domain-containing protein n=1 Tax=Aulographum hederae CBS 113979 TaxID=1176131 RepID=A0A6G1H5X3_9PEZI|nr:hypothetical protein K402DRAFT_373749 [Aulographum hederae CBS 113979]
MPSPNLQSAFSPYTDSPSSPAPFQSAFNKVMNRESSSSEDRHSLDRDSRDSLYPPPSPYPQTVDPSPVDSNNSTSTDATDFEEHVEEQEQDRNLDAQRHDEEIISPSVHSQDSLTRIETDLPARIRVDSEDGPQSVIHAPMGFKQFDTKRPVSYPDGKKSPPFREGAKSPPYHDARQSPPFQRPISSPPSAPPSEKTVVAPGTPPGAAHAQGSNSSPGTLNTAIPPAKPSFGSTPRASTRQEAEQEWNRKIRSTPSLEDIAEADDAERPEDESQSEMDNYEPTMDQALRHLSDAEEEVMKLKTALTECWTLCNTLAGLSSMHRERMFSFGESGGIQEQAWRSCWKLCQQLYESREEDHAQHVRPTLELCREFCQALFEARTRGDEVADSVLRVSFELNNHLYNTHDRNLPDAFRERTLDFYITMCHRLMKQRTSLPEETDTLLRACWSLAEMLFSLRQNKRDNQAPDEELLGSAVQACWELCDLFREGWTQVRPERGTPRPSQQFFPPNVFSQNQHNQQYNHGHMNSSGSISQMLPQSRSNSSLSGTDNTYHSVPSAFPKSFPPETPTTVFDDTTSMSPDEAPVPNILILGPESNSNRARWSSASSTSSYSTTSQRSSTTAGRTAASGSGEPEDPHLVRLKALILKAALNAGYVRPSPNPNNTTSTSSSPPSSSSSTSPTSLAAFVTSLPPTAFGTQPWQLSLLDNYRRLVLSDPALRTGALPPPGAKTAVEVARAVQWMGRTEQFAWLGDLFRLVFGFGVEEVAHGGGGGIGGGMGGKGVRNVWMHV